VKCVNPFSESVKLPAGSVLGRFHSIQGEDIGPSLGDATEGPRQGPSKGRGTVPPHVQELYETACDGCASNGERQALAILLGEYNDVFSSGDHDVGLTRAVRHEIPLVVGPAWPGLPVCRPPLPEVGRPGLVGRRVGRSFLTLQHLLQFPVRHTSPPHGRTACRL